MITFIIYLLLNFVLVSIAFDPYSDIKGTWIRSAKDIQYYDDALCANLRTNKYNTNDYSRYITKYAYKQSCINITEPTRLMNNLGNFELETSELDYQHEYTYPGGNWNLYAICTYLNIPSYIQMKTTYFPNAVCAFFHTDTVTTFLKAYGKNHTMYIYNEDCIEYDSNDYLTVVNGSFVKIMK